MTPRRIETGGPVPQSVHFYKIVALSFLCLTVILFAVIIFMSSKRATIIITTKPTPVDVTTTVNVSEDPGVGEVEGIVKKITVSTTATGVPTGSIEVVGVAKGSVTLHNETGVSQPLIATTRLLTEDGILFRLEDRVTIPANGTIEAKVYADKEGKTGDIGPQDKFTIPGLNATKQKVVYGSSEEPMQGGVSLVGAIGEDDIAVARKNLQEEILDEAKDKLEDMVEDGYEGIFSIIEENISEDEDLLGKEVSTFELAGSATVVGVFYNQQTMKDYGVRALNKHVVDDSEVLEPGDGTPTVTFSDYDEEDGTASVEVFYDGIVTLAPESKQIQKIMFFGKSKDEVRRYVLALDHVKNVEVRFSPAWTRSVPHVADHVNVVVKRME